MAIAILLRPTSPMTQIFSATPMAKHILNEPPSLLRNDLSGKANWIKVKLEGVKSNRSAIGARVLVHYGGKIQAQAVLSQSSFFSCNDSRLHFGLGDSTSANIDVYWPNGLHETFKQMKFGPDERLGVEFRAEFFNGLTTHSSVRRIAAVAVVLSLVK